jgi:signal peptidase I
VQQARAEKRKSGLLGRGGFLVLAVGAVSCVRDAVPSRYRAGSSMVPSLVIGADVAVSKLDRDPRRGTVVVFRAPERPEQKYVKRIIGLPGDTISADGAEILLNGTPIPRCRVGPWSYVEVGGETRSGDIWLEALEGSAWLVFHTAAGGAAPAGPWKVAPGEVFVLGDNRENSHDSRMWYGGKGGGVPLPLVVGVATDVAGPTLPAGAEPLQPALAQCAASLSH